MRDVQGLDVQGLDVAENGGWSVGRLGGIGRFLGIVLVDVAFALVCFLLGGGWAAGVLGLTCEVGGGGLEDESFGRSNQAYLL